MPIIEELEKRDYEIVVTGRDCFQVRELTDLYHLKCKMVGRHSGKMRVRKLVGLVLRAIHMVPFVLQQRPALALSHGSRSQLIAASLMGLQSMAISDYEHARGLVLVRPTWVMHPEIIPSGVYGFDAGKTLKYPGIKEDVYVPRFKPDPSLLTLLGLNGKDIVVTLRPPAEEAHYHNSESDRLFEAVIECLKKQSNLKVVLLPRNDKQGQSIRHAWSDLFASGKFIVPDRAVDGLNLIWHSDLVISGGGTMNREAAALGIPVYSIFRGKIGSVDSYLAQQGRLILVESVEQVHTKILLTRRKHDTPLESGERPALKSIVDHIVKIMEKAAQT